MAIRRWRSGFTLVETLFVLALGVTLLAVALPLLLTGLDESRTASAAHYLAGRCGLARMEAVKRSAAVGLKFEPDGDAWQYAVFLDGNDNGIRTTDIGRAIDLPLSGFERIGDLFAGVTFGLRAGVPEIGGTTATGGNVPADPLRIGTSQIVTFTPIGTATSGTLYLRGRGSPQYAVRILGVTGRTRVFRFDSGSRTWRPR